MVMLIVREVIDRFGCFWFLKGIVSRQYGPCGYQSPYYRAALLAYGWHCCTSETISKFGEIGISILRRKK
jgi:hypothetical protein